MIQRYRIIDDPQWARTIAGSGLTFESAAGIDYFIGEPDLLGKGIGSEAVAAFTSIVFADYLGVDSFVVTPHPICTSPNRVDLIQG